jgi:hypothetical protein
MAVPFSSLHQKADRLQQMAGQIALHLFQARRRPVSSALLARLAQRGARFHALALDTRAAEITERAGCGPVAALGTPASIQRGTQRGQARHAHPDRRQPPAARRAAWRCVRLICWLLLLVFGWGLLGWSLWVGAMRMPAQAVSPARLLVCTKPTLAADPQAPCPQPLPGGTSTTLLGTCPSASSAQGNQVTQIASCTQVSIDANTYAFYGIMGFGLLCLVWWLATLVKAIGGQHPAALGLVVRNLALACFAFLVAWSIQAGFGQLEHLLVAAEQNSEALPFSAVVFLGDVLLILLIRVGVGIALLKMLLSFLAGFGAVAEGHPRALAVTTVKIRVIALLLVVLVVAPWLLTQAAHIITGS